MSLNLISCRLFAREGRGVGKTEREDRERKRERMKQQGRKIVKYCQTICMLEPNEVMVVVVTGAIIDMIMIMVAVLVLVVPDLLGRVIIFPV